MSTNRNDATTTQEGADWSDLAAALPDASSATNVLSGTKSRLLVGEADFSFTAALLEQHSFPREKIVATELHEKSVVIKTYSNDDNDVQQRLLLLEELGVEVLFEIDATNLHEHFSGRRFHRIYFNFPYTDQPITKNAPSDTAKMLKKFFKSAAQVQESGDRVLLTLVYKPNEEYDKATKSGGRKFWHGYAYEIVNATRPSNYRLIGKRRFSIPNGVHRYPTYIHQQTNRSASSENAENARKYVFELIKNAQSVNGPSILTRYIYDTIRVWYFDDMTTDKETDTEDESEKEPKSNQTDAQEKDTTPQE